MGLVGTWSLSRLPVTPVHGVLALAVMVAFSAALLLARRRSETVRGLLDHRDERISAIDLRATAITALAMIVVVLVAFVVQIARGAAAGRTACSASWAG